MRGRAQGVSPLVQARQLFLVSTLGHVNGPRDSRLGFISNVQSGLQGISSPQTVGCFPVVGHGHGSSRTRPTFNVECALCGNNPSDLQTCIAFNALGLRRRFSEVDREVARLTSHIAIAVKAIPSFRAHLGIHGKVALAHGDFVLVGVPEIRQDSPHVL